MLTIAFHLDRLHLSLIPIVLLLFSLIPFPSSVHAVKQEDFKRCEQSGFCTRQRSYAEYASQSQEDPSEDAWSKGYLTRYSMVKDTLKWDTQQGRVYGKLLNSRDQVHLNWVLSLYQDGIVRVQVEEEQADGAKPARYRVSDVLIEGALKPASFKFQQLAGHKSGAYSIEFGDATAVLHLDPFALDVYQNGVLLASVNKKNYFNFEHIRQRPTEEVAVSNETDGRLVQGMWSDTFSKWTDSVPRGPTSFGLDVTFVGADDVFGIPEHATNFSLKTTRGTGAPYTEPYRMYNLDVFEFDLDNPMALYGAVPFLMSHKKDTQRKSAHSAGFFWLNAAETWIDIQKTSVTAGEPMYFQTSQVQRAAEDEPSITSTTTHWMSESGLLDFFILTGPAPKSVMKQYAMLTGSLNLPQQFALGYHQCRWNYLDSQDVAKVNAGFEEHDIPVDVIWLDIEHTDDKRYFTWHASKFADPSAMMKQVAHYARKMVTIIDPHIKRDDNYHVKKQASEKGLFVQTDDGKEFEGWCWPGSSSWIDYINPEGRKFWAQLFGFEQYKGSTDTLFTWNDMNEPSVFTGPEITMPKTNIHWNGIEHRDHRATYSGHVYRSLPAGTLDPSSWFSSSSPISMDKWTTRASFDQGPAPHRPFVLSRAFFAGTQRYGAIWTGDNMAKWSHLESTAPMLLSISLGGIGFCGADVGGFFFDPDTELLTRWYQAGIWYPFFRAHAHIDTKRREPWLFGEPYTSIIRAAIVTRYQFLPYWYTLFRIGQLEGVPPLRPLYFEFPEDRDCFKLEDQYMVGESIMVKPVVKPLSEGGQVQGVYLPGGEPWYNYYNHMAYTANGRIQPFQVQLATPIPTLIRAGRVLPTRQRLRRSSALMHKDPLTLFVTLTTENKAEGEWYLDDGESFAYTRGQFVHKHMKVAPSAHGLLFSVTDRQSITQTMSEWQKPFLGDFAVSSQKMTLVSGSDYKQQINDEVRVERIVVLGAGEVKSRAGVRVRLGSEWKEVEGVQLERVDRSEVYGSEVGGKQGVLSSWRLIMKNPPVGCGLDWEMELYWK